MWVVHDLNVERMMTIVPSSGGGCFGKKNINKNVRFVTPEICYTHLSVFVKAFLTALGNFHSFHKTVMSVTSHFVNPSMSQIYSSPPAYASHLIMYLIKAVTSVYLCVGMCITSHCFYDTHGHVSIPKSFSDIKNRIFISTIICRQHCA